MPDTPDRQWIESIVGRHERALTVYATRMVGDAERGREVVQDTFLRLWTADRPSIEGHLVRWLYTVCRNRALDVRRKERRMTNLSDERTATLGTPPPETGGDRRALALVGELPERQQEALRLKFQGELSYREIAEVMDTTVSNVGVMLHKGIKAIRLRLADLDSTIPGTSSTRG